MQYAHPDDPSRQYHIGAARQQMPNGDWCLTPLDAETAERYGLLPVVAQTPALQPDEVLGGQTIEVDRVGKEIRVTRQKRAKTPAEIDAEVRGSRDLHHEVDVLINAVALALRPEQITPELRALLDRINA